MNLVPCEIKDVQVRTNGYKLSKNLKILQEFIEMDVDCMEVVDYTNKTAESCSNSLRYSIKRYKLSGITACTCNHKVYLVKVSALKK